MIRYQLDCLLHIERPIERGLCLNQLTFNSFEDHEDVINLFFGLDSLDALSQVKDGRISCFSAYFLFS